MAVRLCNHPLAQHLLGRLRDKTTPPDQYRRLAHNLSVLLAIEATRELPLKQVQISTPIEETTVGQLEHTLAVVPVLRAGLGMLDAFLAQFPDVAVGYIGLERDESTAQARRYYAKLPKLEGCTTLCLDPMLATGGSASQALHMLKANGATDLRMVSIISAPDGVARVEADHPDVEIVTAAIDRCLNEHKYIVPGLGDFGDRLYGTP